MQMSQSGNGIVIVSHDGEPIVEKELLTLATNINEIKDGLDEALYKILHGVVQSGPFEGMHLPRETKWKHTRLAPLLIGCYEEELHEEILHQVERLKGLPNPKIANVGCAEGYYAVGMKRLLPNATLYAVDIDQESLAIARKAATDNGVEIVTDAAVDTWMHSDLIIMDCEGNEIYYLDLTKYPYLANSHVIVETHIVKEPQFSGEVIRRRFGRTHNIFWICEGPRDPNKYHFLRGLNSDYRWMAMCEGRPNMMSWIVLTPRGVML